VTFKDISATGNLMLGQYQTCSVKYGQYIEKYSVSLYEANSRLLLYSNWRTVQRHSLSRISSQKCEYLV